MAFFSPEYGEKKYINKNSMTGLKRFLWLQTRHVTNAPRYFQVYKRATRHVISNVITIQTRHVISKFELIFVSVLIGSKIIPGRSLDVSRPVLEIYSQI